MLTRVVKMSFKIDQIDNFFAIFEKVYPKITKKKGCLELKLFSDVQKDNVLYTYSRWESNKDLQNYRESEFFKNTWSEVKKLFQDKPEAWSMKRMSESR